MRTAFVLCAVCCLALFATARAAEEKKAEAPKTEVCKVGEKLVFKGTRSEACVPATSPTKCRAGHKLLCPMCLRSGSCGSCFCAGTGHSLCPAGMHWKDNCPKGAACLVGGHCVADKGKDVKKRCDGGFELRQVMCFRAPCPALCLPSGKPKMPVLPLVPKGEPPLKVKPL